MLTEVAWHVLKALTRECNMRLYSAYYTYVKRHSRQTVSKHACFCVWGYSAGLQALYDKEQPTDRRLAKHTHMHTLFPLPLPETYSDAHSYTHLYECCIAPQHARQVRQRSGLLLLRVLVKVVMRPAPHRVTHLHAGLDRVGQHLGGNSATDFS